MLISTPHDQMLALIDSFADDDMMSFDDKSKKLLLYVEGLDTTNLQLLLGEAGFIPEKYQHDSSEEKVYAKAMDVLIAVSLSRAGYETTVTIERSNAADVTAICPSGDQHTVVLDGKAFRLSRTALNPKDYKIEPLNSWRRGADYASLVGPLAGFPQEGGRLFAEAITYNVTLLTFSHLQFLLEHGLPSCDALVPIWRVSQDILQNVGTSPSAEQYWLELERIFCAALRVDVTEWKNARRRYFNSMLAAADKQIAYFEEQINEIRTLSREELIGRFLESSKLEGKLNQVLNKKRKTVLLLGKIERSE